MKHKYTVLLLPIFLILVGGIFFVFTSNQSQQQTPPTDIATKVTTANDNRSITTSCTGIPTPQQTAGPYYISGSPQRKNIAENLPGEKITVTGYVFDNNCKPIANAWLDFWQADSNGEYDNEGYTLRGHQYTDNTGMYTLKTIIPAAYEARPPHIHVKVRNGNGQVLTSQLYFPNQSQNERDSIFQEETVMKISEVEEGQIATFNFVLKD
jgi:protocatechuate 3,4-dioxygenase beta subunit